MSSLLTNSNSILVPTGPSDFSRQIIFFTLLPTLIASIPCSFFLLYHLIFDRTNRRALRNHVMVTIILSGLTTVLIDCPMVLHYLRTGISPTTTAAGCLFWNYIDSWPYALISLLMLWASIERHTLIFHDRFLNSRKRRLFIHYIPLISIYTYVILFHTIVVFYPFCENTFDYSRVLCGGVCYFTYPVLGFYEQLMHSTIPALLVALVNIALLIRILWQQSHQIGQTVRRQRRRRMFLQLFPVSILYIIGIVPFGVLNCIHSFGLWSDVGVYVQIHLFYLFYFMDALLPFVCLLGMPNLYSKLSCKRQVKITPNGNRIIINKIKD